MNIARDFDKAFRTLRKDGARKLIGDVALALRVRAQAPYEKSFDEVYNVQTEGIALLPGLTIRSPNRELGSEYVPSPGRLMEYVFDRLPDGPHDYTFVDYGSGKGRIILRAARRQFKRVIGVEFADELYAISQRNIAKFIARTQDHAPIEVVLGDAVELPIPQGNCVFFFYNPFRKQVMEHVIRNIETAYTKAPRKFYLVHLALSDERGNDADANRRLIEEQRFLKRCKAFSGTGNLWARLQFDSFKLDIFESINASANERK